MSWRTILVSIFLLSMAISVTFVRSIHEPNVPEPVALPLGEINRYQLERPGFVEIRSSDRNTLESLPANAWCEQLTTPLLATVTLGCYWPDNSTEEVWFSRITLELPREGDTIYWKFDRATLQVVPQSHSWLIINLGYIIGALVFGFFAFCAALSFFYLTRQKQATFS